tara:strand:+ start:87 stop:554 length:468 start_codon:yes stop_codon:yes gene_type:complete
MTGEERLNEFQEAVEKWSSSKHLATVKAPKEVVRILNFNKETLTILTGEECLCYAYELHAYSEYLETIKAKENATLEWADSSIWYIISTAMQNYGTQYTKWQEKYYSAIKENPLASEILKIKHHAEARVGTINNKSERVQKMADILNNLSRTKRR